MYTLESVDVDLMGCHGMLDLYRINGISCSSFDSEVTYAGNLVNCRLYRGCIYSSWVSKRTNNWGVLPCNLDACRGQGFLPISPNPLCQEVLFLSVPT